MQGTTVPPAGVFRLSEWLGGWFLDATDKERDDNDLQVDADTWKH